jgi:cytochrome b involved in lipid metabolism
MPADTLYTWEEIRKHNKDTDLWVVMYGHVCDMTDFLHEHPGGLDPIFDLGGFTASTTFEALGHSAEATAIWKKCIIGKVDPQSVEPVAAKKVVKEVAPIRYGSTFTMTRMLIAFALFALIVIYAAVA